MTVLHDLRYALRIAWRDRAFSLIAVVTLALGIGANTALFTIVNAVVLAPLPFRQPEQLVRVTVDFTKQHVPDVGLSIPELLDLRAADLFDDIAGIWPVSANLTETDEPERVETALVDANYFSMLGIGAQVGRVFGKGDAIPGIAEVAVISDALWQRRFGGDPHGPRQADPHRQRHVPRSSASRRRRSGIRDAGRRRTSRSGRPPAGWRRHFRRSRSAARSSCRAGSAG